MVGREDFRCPSQPGHAACPEDSPTPDVTLGSLADGRLRLALHARNAILWCQSVGLSFGTATATTTLDRPPHHSSAFFSSLFFYVPSKRP
jgi:hypothetical protein